MDSITTLPTLTRFAVFAAVACRTATEVIVLLYDGTGGVILTWIRMAGIGCEKVGKEEKNASPDILCKRPV